MNIIIASIPENKKEWFLTAFNQFKVKHKILTYDTKEDIEIDGWETLSEEQKTEINEAIAELDAGKGIPHHQVMANIRKR
ncbi:MAG: hypothetical protein A2033_14540 [Bacteroidetes bacterium GWA2_31_9]|nr:MAG: hypothetical protein A2033_14540 [Bacteroidetes bacterium GWA2_31_9]